MFAKIAIALLSIVCLPSYKYLPGSYTIRFFWIVLKWLYLEKPDKSWKKSPFNELTRNSKCSLLECDLFGFHKNNVTYFTELDLCRTECTLIALINYFQNSVKNGKKFAFIPLASITNHFLKEIKPFQNYQMHTKIIGWGNKWVWLITVFTVDEKIKKIDNDINNNNLDPLLPESIPPLYLYNNDGNENKFGKRVCCISLGKLVFKEGRKTLKPWDVVQLAGNEDVKLNQLANSNEEQVVANTNNAMELLKIYESC